MDAGYLLSTLGENWLDLALTHVVTQWLGRSLQDLLPLLIAGDISSETFATEIDALLQSRNLVTLSGQKNPRSNVAQALKSIAPNHPAIALVSLAPDEYRILNDAQLGKLGDTQPKYITSKVAQSVVDRATDLLSSAEWSDVSAGLAVLVAGALVRFCCLILPPSLPTPSCFQIWLRNPPMKLTLRLKFRLWLLPIWF